MFIYTFNENTYEKLKDKLKLIQKMKCNNKILYVFEFDKSVYEKYSNDNDIWIDNKLHF